MYCPRCGQQQASGDLRFCSRCGLPMGVISQVLANGGTLPQLMELNQQRSLVTRKNGLKVALIWFLFLDFLLVPLIAIMGGEEIVAIAAVLGFVGAMIITLISFLFFKSEPKYLINQDFAQYEMQGQQYLGENQSQGALPPQQTQAAQDYVAPAQSWKAPDTGDLVVPGSVTEGTTKLLKKDE
jgi:hypothetical protein